MPLEISEQTIVFGPFETEHFRANAGPRQRAWFLTKVVEEIVPQLTGPVRSVKGRVFSHYDKLRHVGPYSLVKDHYVFELVFTSADEIEKVTGSFDSREGHQSVSFTVENRASAVRDAEAHALAIEEMCATADPDITIGDPRFADWTGPNLATAGAKTLEEGVVFGPFATEHFQNQADAKFRADFLNFVRKTILPRNKGKTPLIRGQVVAAYDGPRYLGPNSALKFRYSFEICFSSAKGEEAASGVVDYSHDTGSFSTGKYGVCCDNFANRKAYHSRKLIRARIAFRYQQGQRKILCPTCGNPHLLRFDDFAEYDRVIVSTESCPLKFEFSRVEDEVPPNLVAGAAK
jgi:hypothetical protein